MRDMRSKDASYIAYSPEMDISSCGPTEEKARMNLHEAIEILVEEEKNQGTLAKFLNNLGFQKQSNKWIPPRVSFESFSLLI